MLVKQQGPVYTAYDKLVEKRRDELAKAVAKVKAAYDRKHGRELQANIPEHER